MSEITFFMCGRGKKKEKETKYKCTNCGKYFTSSDQYLIHKSDGKRCEKK